MDYIHRELERKFVEASQFFKAVLVIGRVRWANPQCSGTWHGNSYPMADAVNDEGI